MKTLFTIVWVPFFLVLMLMCLPAYIVIRILKPMLKRNAYQSLVSSSASFWGKVTVLSTGSKVQILGEENIPDHTNICYVSNHQGQFDIPVLLGFMKTPLGFIAKQELFKIPILSYWMKELHCIFIDRKNARNAIKTFEAGAEVIRSGYPLVIFPEGTRSKSDTMGSFHVGSIKLATMANATIVPLCIKGTWRAFEKHHRICPAAITVQIMSPISAQEYQGLDKQSLVNMVKESIQTGFGS